MRIDLATRAVATEAVIATFRGRPFSWKRGRTCLHLLREQLIALGHAPPEIPGFHTERGAVRAMRRAGFADLVAVADSLLPRIAPARLLVGDVALLPGVRPFDAIVICAGADVVGYREGLGALAVITGVSRGDFIAAWRV